LVDGLEKIVDVTVSINVRPAADYIQGLEDAENRAARILVFGLTP